MRERGGHRSDLGLREIVVEASLALARLDAERLEELALSCEALNRDLVHANDDARVNLARQDQDAAQEMAVFGRVLEATRSNLDVMSRLRNFKDGRLEYRCGPAASYQPRSHWAATENRHGDH